MRPTLTILCLVLALAACRKPAKSSEEALSPPVDPVAASSISDFSQDMTALGTEPFWNLTIKGTAFKLTRPDQPAVSGVAPGAVIVPGQAVWSVPVTSATGMKVTLSMSECSDGMSDNRYPMTAEVVLGELTLVGCAAKTVEMPREGDG